METQIKKATAVRGRPFRKDINYRQDTKLVRLSPSSFKILNGMQKGSMDQSVKHIWKLLMQKGKLLKAQEEVIQEQRQFIEEQQSQLNKAKAQR